MTTRKLRRFGDGGGVREGQNANIDDETRARARKFVEDADTPKPAVVGRATPKQRVVSKKELEDSGLSLRDYLNKERGLTRRGESAPAKAKPKAGTSDSSNEGRGQSGKGKSNVDQIPLDAPRTPVKGEKADSTELGRNIGNAMNALPGIQAVGRIPGAAKAAQKAAGSRAVSTAVDDGVTFLGKSGRRQVGGFDEVGSSGARQLVNNPTKRLEAPPKQIGGPSKAELVAKNRAARQAARKEAMDEENATRHGLDRSADDFAEKAADVRKNLGGDDFSLGMKRGGKVKSSPSKPAAKGWGMARGARGAKMR
jgi:hypothetical protein